MFELIWSIFNTALLIYFLIISFKTTKIIREQLGVLATLVFVCGFLSVIGNCVIGRSSSQNSNSNSKNSMVYLSEKNLEKSLSTNICMLILFEKNETSNKILNSQPLKRAIFNFRKN